MEIIEMIMPIIVLAILGFGMLWGFIRKFHRTLFRFVFLLLAMGGAYLLSKMLGSTVSAYVFAWLNTLEVAGLSDLLNNTEAADLVAALCRILASPILFLVFYILLKPISWIPYKICTILFGIKGPKLFGRLSGALAGLLCGIVGLIVFVTPVFGYLNLVEDTVKSLMSEEEIAEEFAAIMDITDTPVAAQAHGLVGKHLFTGLTTTKMGEEEISLEGEIAALATAIEDGKILLEKSPEEYGPAEGQAMEELAHDVGESHILSALLSAGLAETSEAWLKGEEAFGMEKPDMGADMQDIMDAFFLVFTTSNSQNIEQDLTTFAMVFEIFIEHDMPALLSEDGDTTLFVEKLVSDGVVVDLYDVLEQNPRMAPVKTAIIDTGMRVMLEHLGVAENLRENHGELMEEIVETVQKVVNEDGSLDMPALSSGIKEALQDKEIEISDEVAQIAADGIAEIYTNEELDTLTMSELVDKLIDRFAEAELPEDITVPDGWKDLVPKQ